VRADSDANPTELIKATDDASVQLDSDKEDFDSNVEPKSNHLDSEKHPTTQATVAAKKKLKVWLNQPIDKDIYLGLGSVANGQIATYVIN